MKSWLSLDKPISRERYFVLGLLLFILKHALDRVAAALNHRPWGLLNYWTPLDRVVSISSLTPEDRGFLATMVILAIPFIVAGVVLTLRRLRTLAWPGWLVVIFFFPVVNLALFATLSIVATRQSPPISFRERDGLAELIPDSKLGSAAVSLLITIPLGLLMTILATMVLAKYGWGLFVAVPFSVGAGAALIHGSRRPRGLADCVSVALAANILLGGVLLLFAFEGAVCLIMAAPLAIPLGALGGAVGYALHQRPKQQAPAMLAIVLLFSPGFMGVEQMFPRESPTLKVITSIDVNAPPDRVWKNVVSFAELPPPTEALFRAGIAYPIRAHIEGSGVGPIRKCEFSTGPFVEPIQVWDQPHLLRFSVTANPQPMQEWTPYRHIQPPHLNRYLLSRQGQFLLTSLPGGRTRLEGTTWYQHNLWPARYWQLWSDAILHQIHLRVLRHIKQVSEGV